MTIRRSDPKPDCRFCHGAGIVSVSKDPDEIADCVCTDPTEPTVEMPEGFDRVQRFADMAAAQFDSELDYFGNEIKRRILMTAHHLDPEHPARAADCIVCADDDKLDFAGEGDDV